MTLEQILKIHSENDPEYWEEEDGTLTFSIETIREFAADCYLEGQKSSLVSQQKERFDAFMKG